MNLERGRKDLPLRKFGRFLHNSAVASRLSGQESERSPGWQMFFEALFVAIGIGGLLPHCFSPIFCAKDGFCAPGGSTHNESVGEAARQLGKASFSRRLE